MEIGRKIAPAGFILFLVTALIATAIAASFAGWSDGALIGFDVGALVFLLSLVPLLRECDAAQMRHRALANDADRGMLLLVTAAITLVILVAVALELRQKGNPGTATIILIVATLALSWLFLNSLFALHYAHMYYLKDNSTGKDAGGAIFPKTPEPDYWDFIYFSYCLGMTFQTSDTNITSGRFRRVITLQCLISFVFSIGVIAFTINVLGSVGSK